MRNPTAITDQRASERPISFVLDRGGVLGTVITLTIRPEDLTRNQPSRVSVHQTLGRDVSGWVDDFGEGLGSVTIAGHTGWGAGGRPDGVNAFIALNDLVSHDYHAARQAAINSGRDPSTIKLLFIDTLDDFAWSVTPTQFVLRRSKSRPLLMQYNITLQAVSNSIDDSFSAAPFFGSTFGGLDAIGGAISELDSFVGSIQDKVSSAVSLINGELSPIGLATKKYMQMSLRLFKTVSSGISAIDNGSASVTNNLISIATDLSRVGANIFKSYSAIANLPSSLKADMMSVGAAYNEVYCIFKNSLRPEKVYEDYTGLYGASNCSSTTGGNAASAYANKNSFDLMTAGKYPVSSSSSALSSVNALVRHDPVLAPLPMAEIDRHLNNITSGVVV